jgi:hypothetical protein
MSSNQDSQYIRTPNIPSNPSDHVNESVGPNPMGLGIQDSNGVNYFNAQHTQSQRLLEATTEQGSISPQSIPIEFSPATQHSCQQSFTAEHALTSPIVTLESSLRTNSFSAHSTCPSLFSAATGPSSGSWTELCWGDTTDADMKLLRGPVEVLKIDKRLTITGRDDDKGEKLKIIGEWASCLCRRMLISYSRLSRGRGAHSSVHL